MKYQLNETQYRAFLNFRKAYEEMVATGVSVIRDNYTDNLMFIDGTDIKLFLNPSEITDYPESVDITSDVCNSDNTMTAIIDAAFYSCDRDKIHILTK